MAGLKFHVAAMPRRQLSARVNVHLRIVNGSRRLAEAYSYKLKLPRISRNVTCSKYTRNICFHPSIHDNRAALDIDTPFSNRAERRDKAKVYDDGIDVQFGRFSCFNIR